MKTPEVFSRYLKTLFAAVMLCILAMPAQAATDTEINDAIQDGLAWLATQQHATYGYFGTSYYLANTAAAVLAFENEGHFPGGSTAYSTVVENGLDYLFTRCYKLSIGTQPSGNPDSNGNGTGVYFNYNSRNYETGMVMQAIVASNTPDRVVSGGACDGMTYRQVVEDLVDYVAWAQNDNGTGRGAWDYGWNTYRGDNSISQWPVLGLVAAEQWGIMAPDWVADELSLWIDYVQNDISGGSGYTNPNDMVNVSKTGGLLVEMHYVGDDRDSSRSLSALGFINSRWNNAPSSWYGNKGHPYAMFAVFKGLELMQVPIVPNALANTETPAGDWWGDYAEYLVNTQTIGGNWSGYYYWGQHLATPWNIVILQASVFPISVDVVVPDSACDDLGYDVTVNYSVERFEADGTLTVYKGGELYDQLILSGFTGSDSVHYTIPYDEVGNNDWYAVLEVTGGGISTMAEDSDSGMIYDTPEVTDIPNQVLPFEPFDLDDYQTCECAEVDWAAENVPAGWSVVIDVNNVVTVTAPEDAIDPAEIKFVATFHWDAIDCIGWDYAIFAPNQPPVAHTGKDYSLGEVYEVFEGGTVMVDGSQSYDPDGDSITMSWDLDGDTVENFDWPGAMAEFSAVGLDNPPTERVYIYLRVCDEHGACSDGRARVNILDQVPSAAFTWLPEPQDEGSPVQFTDLSISVVDEIVQWDWDFGGIGSSMAKNPAFTFADDAVYPVCLLVTDDDASTGNVCHDVTVLNVAPVLGQITAPSDPVAIGTPITAGADFTDAGIEDTHTAVWSWGDGSTVGTVTQGAGSGSVLDTHTYVIPGVYTLDLTLTDDDGGSDTASYQYVVVYDPDGAFVTGGGFIDSPAGAYTPDPTLTGHASFGFVSKYHKGAKVPDGNTQFQFHAAGMDFKSTAYDWLVVAGARAQYKGIGTIRDVDGVFKFFLTAIDGDLLGGDGTDKFRIKIWDAEDDENVIYDNQMEAPDDADPTTAIVDGSIVIHTKDKK